MGNILLNLGERIDRSSSVLISPEQLFGCHCAILGASGSGKSWTLSRCLEESAKFKAKIILLDASGEHGQLDHRTFHVHLSSPGTPSTIPEPENSHPVTAPYFELAESDLFSLFGPTSHLQLVKLQSAVRTLKLLQCAPELSESGIFQKANKIKNRYEELGKLHKKSIGRPDSIFNIYNLAEQLAQECVDPCGSDLEARCWGGPNSEEQRECVPLMQSIEELLNQPSLASIFKPPSGPSIFEALEKFLTDENISILRISLAQIPSTHRIRPIMAEAIARTLVSFARTGTLLNSPVVLALDDSHQLMTTHKKHAHFEKDGCSVFETLAKEGRKMGLTLCLACQQPSDIPESILTQCSCMIAHRLTGRNEQEIVARAIGNLNETAIKNLSTLPQGTALVSHGNHSVLMRMHTPTRPPLSQGPDYQNTWQNPPSPDLS